MGQPNIIYIHSHDTGRYVQPYGFAIPTPNIQKLAEGGSTFRQAFCANPTCSPSRACLLTGQWAHSCDMTGLVNRGWSLPEPEHLLSHVLAGAGYETALAGFQHVVRDVETGGWQRILANESKASTEDRAVAFLAETRKKPFYLDIGFSETHRKGRGFAEQPAGEAKTDPRYVRPALPFLDTPEARQDLAEYIDSARTLDLKMGKVFDALAAHGLVQDTLVICTTDHGIAFPSMKCHLTDHGTGIMLIMRGPGGFGEGKVIDALVSQIDLFPTVCELAGIRPPAWLQGVSMLPLVAGQDTGANSIRDAVFADVNYHACYEPQRMVRTQRYKYIRKFHSRKTVMLPNCDQSITKDQWQRHGWHERVVPEDRLYDLMFDPTETNNLVNDPAYQAVGVDMRSRLLTWMKETGDPLPDHPVVAHPDGVVNDEDDPSPSTGTQFNARAYYGHTKG
jgi:N-sulfoglucosamine sulfohydrolase